MHSSNLLWKSAYVPPFLREASLLHHVWGSKPKKFFLQSKEESHRVHVLKHTIPATGVDAMCKLSSTGIACPHTLAHCSALQQRGRLRRAN
jgi:hypothetical protein